MSHDPGMHDPITVSVGDISVEKVFVDDEFPVPAIKFVITSESDDSVDIRLTDSVPESFPMDCVGFHPDYDNDHWTAYQDHRVEFVRTLDPNGELTTVYGIRLDETDVDAEAFLEAPYLDLKSTDESGGSEAEGVEDIVGADNNEAVRDVLSGESDVVPGMEESADSYDDEFEDGPTDDPLAGEAQADPLAADPLDADESEQSFNEADSLDDFDEEPDDDAEEPVVLDDPLADEGDGETDGHETLDLDEPSEEDDDAEDTTEPLVLDDPLEEDVDDGEAVEADAEPSTPEPRPLNGDTLPAVVERPEDATLHRRVDVEDTETATDESEEPVDDSEADGSDAVADSAADVATDPKASAADPDSAVGDSDPDRDHAGSETAGSPGLAAGGIAAALATEIREGSVDDDDLAVLKRELDIGVPNSVNVRIHRLQSQMDDLEAYSDALAEFIDEEGTGEQLISEFRSEVSALSESIDALETTVDGAEADRADLRHEIEGVDAAVGDVEARVEATEDELSALSEEVDGFSAVAADVDELAVSVDSLDDEMGDVRADLADLDGDIVDTRMELEAEMEELRVDVREDLRDDVDDFGDELDAIRSDIEELEEFRDRLASTFGGN